MRFGIDCLARRTGALGNISQPAKKQQSTRVNLPIIFLGVLCIVPIGTSLVYTFMISLPPHKNLAQNVPLEKEAEPSYYLPSTQEVISAEPKPPLQIETNRQSGQFVGFSMLSNGYTWNAAPQFEKKRLCEALARVSLRPHETQKEVSDFYYGALSAFYDTPDAEILRTKINDIVSLLDNATR
jgi:hypothetical protein